MSSWRSGQNVIVFSRRASVLPPVGTGRIATRSCGSFDFFGWNHGAWCRRRQILDHRRPPGFSACFLSWEQHHAAASRSRGRPLTSPNILAKIIFMKRVKIGEFRDRASELIRRAAGGETVVILNRDREVAKIVPITAKTGRAGGLVGSLAGTAEVRGDIEAPIARADAWFRKPS